MASFYSQIENMYALLDLEKNRDEDCFSSMVAEVESEDNINVFTCDRWGKSLKTERGFKLQLSCSMLLYMEPVDTKTNK